MHKKILNQEHLRDVMLPAVSELAGIVKKTLGPGGRTILIQRVGQALNGEPLGPKITKDGVSVADECGSKDPEKDLIMQAVKNVCKKTNSTAGDGTTTAIVLGEAILKETLEYLEKHPSKNPQLVKESIDLEVKKIQEKLKEISKPIDNMELVKQVATISANGDTEVGDIIGEAFKAVGAEGVVTVDEGSTTEVTLDVIDGYQINRGVEGQSRLFNNKDNTKFESDSSNIIIYDGKLQNYVELAKALASIAKKDERGNPSELNPTIILANEFSNEVISWIIIQKETAGLNLCPVRGPHQTSVRTAYYDDIAVLTGGLRLGNGNKSLAAMEPQDAGRVSRVIADKYKCTFYEGAGNKKSLLNRVDQLKSQKKLAESPYDAQVINDRLAALTCGVAKIGVGGSTDFEIKERYDRIEDALNAARAAIEEGVIPGGGATLFRIAHSLKIDPLTSPGKQILFKALQYPLLQILENIGAAKKTVDEVGEVLRTEDQTVYNARRKKFENYLEAGIVDPVKVTRLALENANSIASLLSTAGGGIIYVKD